MNATITEEIQAQIDSHAAAEASREIRRRERQRDRAASLARVAAKMANALSVEACASDDLDVIRPLVRAVNVYADRAQRLWLIAAHYEAMLSDD